MKIKHLAIWGFLASASFINSQTTWNTNGNNITVNDYIGSNSATNTNPIRFKTGTGSTAPERMRINGGVDGFVGIGTGNPLTKLHVNGDITFGNDMNSRRWKLFTQSWLTQGKLFLAPDLNGQSDMGSALTINPLNSTLIFGNETGNSNFITGKCIQLKNNSLTTPLSVIPGTSYMAFNLQRGNGTNGLWYTNPGSGGAIMWGNQAGSLSFAPVYGEASSATSWYNDDDISSKKTLEIRWNNIYNTGQIVVGPKAITSGSHQDFRMSIDGKLVAKEIYVTANNWADYVFEKDYKLIDLDELEKFIDTKKHLPNIPSTSEIKEYGIDIANTNRLLLEKIEELTLYILQQNKKIKQLEKKIEEY